MSLQVSTVLEDI